MSTSNSLYDAPTREIYLLENLKILGRKTELRQLLKLLNLAKTGQPKAALVTGDAGIGKTALLEAFTALVREGVYCRILDLGKMDFDSPEALYAGIIGKLQAEANQILDEALAAVNDITGELDLHWERQDLVRAIALVKLQESIGGKEAISQEQLVKAIRSQVPAIKKLKFSVNESIQKLVDLIVNPWVMVATSLLNPMSPPLQEAIRLAETIRDNRYSGPEPRDERVDMEEAALHTVDTVIYPQQSPVETRTEPLPDFQAPALTESFPSDASALTFKPHQTPTVSHHRAETARPIKDPLIRHLMTVFNFINSAIENIDSALLIVADEWDRSLNAQAQSELKDFMSELLYQITERKNYHYMVVLTARTEGESYTLGGNLYNHFRTKLLLDPLNESACRKLLRSEFNKLDVELDEEVTRRVQAMSKGNPFWHLKITSYLRERVESNRLRHVDMDFFEKLSIEHVSQLLELSFTRLKLTFLNDEESLYKVIAALIKQFGESPFPANLAIREISASQGFANGYVFEVLRALFRHDFISQVDMADVPLDRDTDGRLLEDRNRKREPHYVIQSRFVLTFLQEKTRAIQTDISTDEKLMYLKKIIPLSVKSGELDREKTMEVLSLSDAMSRPEMVQFLEDIFTESLKDDKPVVRVTALNNIALIDSARARDALFKALRDEDSMVREYAARNLALLSQKSSDHELADRIVDVLVQAIDDESDAVRAQVYGTLARYRWQRDLMNVFTKGLSDACDSVRLTSIKSLVEMEAQSPFVFNSLLDTMDDEVPEIRRYACLGLQRYPRAESIDAIVNMLQTDANSGLRALAAESLSRMEDAKAFAALVDALRNEGSEDVKLAVARALGKRRGWQTEEILLESLQNTDMEAMPVFVWACIRSLGYVGGTERSLHLLSELRARTTNPILISVLEMASRKISGRIEELRQMERQLGEATPVTVAIPSEYQEEVSLVEEEVISSLDLDVDEEPNPGPPPIELPFQRRNG